jgi:hypothetical protein
MGDNRPPVDEPVGAAGNLRLPALFMGELYHLEDHIGVVRRRLEERRADLVGPPSPAPA